jgi:uncharacterized repeat protein (TIGR04076 family)
MPKFKITVLKRMANQDLADKYCVPEATAPCPYFTDGQEFIVESGGRQPENFCGWAWNDIHKSYLVLRHGGGFSGWMKDEDTIIACCTDGIRPVVFEVKRLED